MGFRVCGLGRWDVGLSRFGFWGWRGVKLVRALGVNWFGGKQARWSTGWVVNWLGGQLGVSWFGLWGLGLEAMREGEG